MNVFTFILTIYINEMKRYLHDGEFNDHDLIVKLQHTDDKLMNQ